MSNIPETVRAIEAEMRRIGYSTDTAPQALDLSKQYAGVSFEHWLQFVYLPAVSVGVVSGDLSSVLGYRVGLAALRQYDYHSTVEEAHPLMRLCQDLERLLNDEKAGIA